MTILKKLTLVKTQSGQSQAEAPEREEREQRHPKPTEASPKRDKEAKPTVDFEEPQNVKAKPPNERSERRLRDRDVKNNEPNTGSPQGTSKHKREPKPETNTKLQTEREERRQKDYKTPKSAHRSEQEPKKVKQSVEYEGSPERDIKHSGARQEKKPTSSRGHRRGASSVASQESYELPSPRTPSPRGRTLRTKSSTPRIVEDEDEDLSVVESPPIPPGKSSAVPAPTNIPGPNLVSQTNRPPSFKGSLPRQVYKRRNSRTQQMPNMGEGLGNKPSRDGKVPKAQKEDSFVQVNGRESDKKGSKEQAEATGDVQSQVQEGVDFASALKFGNTREQTKAAKNGDDQPRHGDESSGLGAGTAGEQDAETGAEKSPSRGLDYASALKSGLSSDDDGRARDDDESYPDLDDMSMSEIHVPDPSAPTMGGIRWAPRNVPLQRRMQTLVVLMHSLCIGASVSLFFAFCANPFAWPLLLLYLLHVLSSKAATDGSLRGRSEWMRRSRIWHLFADYFPAKLHKTHDLPPTRKYIFGYHPHGIISHGAWAAFATDALGFSEKFPGITNSLLTLDSNFRIPFYREYVLGMGVRSVSKESIVNLLTKGGSNDEGMGRGVTVVVGGARESLEAQPGTLRLVLKERKGFVKIAVRTGADLVPVLAFGENNLYDQLRPREHPLVHRIQMFALRAWKFTLPFLHGRGIFNYDVGLMPYRRPLHIVVGQPIKVRQSSSVDPDEINRLHGLYVAELQKLWDRYKDEFAPDRKEEMQILP
ncbi:diacylglycerol acyltransferase-domain-containing protein [Xylariomycetidae sp. FL0641]|nr:diacylglycerol acyltransferase-domain-containing protein [Xylariomycetidae sp. FL0641]